MHYGGVEPAVILEPIDSVAPETGDQFKNELIKRALAEPVEMSAKVLRALAREAIFVRGNCDPSLGPGCACQRAGALVFLHLCRPPLAGAEGSAVGHKLIDRVHVVADRSPNPNEWDLGNACDSRLLKEGF
jgi:hypothetical protein